MKERRQFWVILTIVFLGFLGISMPYLIFPALFLNPEYSILPISSSQTMKVILLGITLAVYPLGQFLGSPILGSLSDDYGRKTLLWTTLIASAFANLATGIAIHIQGLTLLIISRFLAGMMEGNIAIARALASELKTFSKHEAFGKINASSSIAFLIGPLIGGLLTDKSLSPLLTTSTPFYCICIFFLALSALTALILDPSTSKPTTPIRSFASRINIFKRISELFTNKTLQFLLITWTAFTLSIDMFYEFGPVYLTLKWTLGPPELTLYNSVLCLALAIGNGLLPSLLSKKMHKRTAILASLISLTLILTLVPLTNIPFLMALLFGLSGLAIGITSTFLTVNISNSVPDAIQGEVLGVQVSLRVLGDALICLFGSAFLLISPKVVLFLSAGIAAVTLGYYWRRGASQ